MFSTIGAAPDTGGFASTSSSVSRRQRQPLSDGRIETLLIEADRLIPGRIDAESGAIAAGDLSNPEVDDVLDDLGEYVFKSGGEVIIVPTERIPTRTGAAAIFRF